MTVYIGIDEDEAPEDAAISTPNAAFWELKKEIYETIKEEDAERFGLFIGMMNDETVSVDDVVELKEEANGIRELIKDDNNKMLLDGIGEVIDYCIRNKKGIVKN